jgi:hypothetical protein
MLGLAPDDGRSFGTRMDRKLGYDDKMKNETLRIIQEQESGGARMGYTPTMR